MSIKYSTSIKSIKSIMAIVDIGLIGLIRPVIRGAKSLIGKGALLLVGLAKQYSQFVSLEVQLWRYARMPPKWSG